MRILLVEDEKYLADALVAILKKNNYTVDHVSDGETGLDCAMSEIYDVLLLDIMLPKMSGLKILKHFRETNKTTPVIMLTARSEITDKVSALDEGADDYLAKPFNTDELLARIRAVSRRESKIVSEHFNVSYGDITLNTSLLRLSSNTAHVTLTHKESKLLEYLLHNNSMVLSKDKIIEKIWGYDSEVEDNNVEVYISFLRKKLTYIKSNVTIITIRGLGYKMAERQ